jgi:AcrR family transcriptional regulator
VNRAAATAATTAATAPATAAAPAAPAAPAPAAPVPAAATTAPAATTGRPAARLTPAARRQQILATARRLVESGRVERVSVEAVAEHAGVSPGLLFHYFGTQRKFRQAVIEEIAGELLAQVQPDPALSPVDQLRAGLETFVGYVARHPELYLAVVRPVDEDLAGLHRSMRSRLAELLVSGLSEAGAPMSAAITTTIAGWLAFAEEALLGWIADPSMAQAIPPAGLVDLCHRACLVLLEAAVPDPRDRARLAQALHKQRAKSPRINNVHVPAPEG